MRTLGNSQFSLLASLSLSQPIPIPSPDLTTPCRFPSWGRLLHPHQLRLTSWEAEESKAGSHSSRQESTGNTTYTSYFVGEDRKPPLSHRGLSARL